MEMRKETKQRWLEDLRSGKYKQCRDQMFDIDGGTTSYCCLGVLNFCTLGGNIFTGDNTPEYNSLINQDHDTIHYLARLNDGKVGKMPLSFSEIADYIEENVVAV